MWSVENNVLLLVGIALESHCSESKLNILVSNNFSVYTFRYILRRNNYICAAMKKRAQ